MGIFTSNTLSSVSGVDYTELPALEGYDATTGCAMAMLEVQQNDMALFNATIMEDFKEVAAVNEGYEVLNESASDVLNKIKEIFKKLLQKIKGIFSAFIARLRGTFGSNAGMYDKYYKQIARYTNWKDFKVKKFREVKGDGDGINQILKVGDYKNDSDYYTNAMKYIGQVGEKPEIYGIKLDVKEDFADTDEINEAIIKNRLSDDIKNEVDSDLKNMTEAFMDAVFEDEDDKDEWTVSEILNGCVGSLLQKNAGGKFESSIKKSNDKLIKAINKIIDEISKWQVAVSKATGNANLDKGSNEFSMKAAGINKTTKDRKGSNYKASVITDDNVKASVNKNDPMPSIYVQHLQKIATQEQQVIVSFTSAIMATTKFLIAQARRVWSSAAAYSSREHKNEGYEFYTAVGESAAYDFISHMEIIGE